MQGGKSDISIQLSAECPTFPLIPRFQWGDYEAISYCWESDIREKEIYVNGTLFQVPKNLEALLRKLRALPDSRTGMKFWVDALCINQDNIEERNNQVKLMNSIYTQAFAVIVWLGEDLHESEKAIDFMASVSRSNLDGEDAVIRFGEHWKESHTRRTSEFLALPWNSLLSFFDRTYWRRLWIVQELALNHNMTLFLCGKRQISRSMLLHTCEFFEKNIEAIDYLIAPNLEVETKSPSPMYGSIWPIIYHVHSLLQTQGQRVGEAGIDTLLDLTRKAKVKDARDKIYGILGLLPSHFSTMITPNYAASKSVEEVYTEFARILLSDSKRLDSILSWCSYKPNTSIPSWVPDWTSKFSRNHVKRLKDRTASGSRTAQWSVSGDCLHVRGIKVGRVTSTSLSQSENAPLQSKMSDVHKDIPHSYGDELSYALSRTLVMDHASVDVSASVLDIYWTDEQDISSIDSSAEMQMITKNLSWNAFDQFRHKNAKFSVFGRQFQRFFPTSREPQTDKLRRENFWAMLIAVIASIGRKMITTSEGYLGLAPEEVQQDDVVAILYGCNFPVILRACGKRYTMIGESYIHGIMNGEVVEVWEKGKSNYKEEDFILC
ncbi:heterokaryon incompatibility -domain-containing protein [Rutstroemia sp. NJR-2017a BBW]|nr:heterokaryon incompatibility -domain-containing protein [Rutstroemia sp. NJR-2017a BBW]